jgi:xeroderma pigmentosum group C-complementing protein
MLHDGGGGGFLIGADDVVQPYHLPRYRYQPVETPSSPGTPAEPEQTGNAIASTSGASFPPEFRTYALETMEDDQDLDLGEDDMSSDPRPMSLSVLANGIPKSMREMAEDAERRARRGSSEALDRDSEGDYHPGTPSSSKSAMATNGPAAKYAVNGKTTPTSRRAAVAKKRGREELVVGSPAKRVRGSGTSSPATPASGRVLRPRTSKSAAKIQEEKDLDEAFRRATEA